MKISLPREEITSPSLTVSLLAVLGPGGPSTWLGWREAPSPPAISLTDPRPAFTPGCFTEELRTVFYLPNFRHCLGIDSFFFFFFPIPPPSCEEFDLIFPGVSLFNLPDNGIFFSSHQNYHFFFKCPHSFYSGY